MDLETARHQLPTQVIGICGLPGMHRRVCGRYHQYFHGIGALFISGIVRKMVMERRSRSWNAEAMPRGSLQKYESSSS